MTESSPATETTTNRTSIGSALSTMFRILFFQADRDEILALNNTHLQVGLLCTWIAGIGRSWDDAHANIWQHLGVGSVFYVFILSAFLWLIIMPLAPANWSYKRLLTFITLTSPPAILYAIPVEMFFNAQTAVTINLYFLGIVATWRVLLLLFYLHQTAELHPVKTISAALFPLSIIVGVIGYINLDKVVFDSLTVMGGLRGEPRPDVYWPLQLLAAGAVVFIPTLCVYLWTIYSALTKPTR